MESTNIVQEDLNTILLYLVEKNNIDLVKKFIANCADVNAKYDNGMTALMLASINGHKEICELLIENGADVNFEDGDYEDGDYEEETPLYEAIKCNNIEICKLLIDNGAIVNKKIYISEIYNYGNDPRDCCETTSEMTMLMIAICKGNYNICKLLIEKGADVNAKTFCGRDALITAINEECYDICKLLIEKGALIDDRSYNIINKINGGKDVLDLYNYMKRRHLLSIWKY